MKTLLLLVSIISILIVTQSTLIFTRISYVKYETKNTLGPNSITDAHQIRIETFESIEKYELVNDEYEFLYYDYYDTDNSLLYSKTKDNDLLNERYKRFLPNKNGLHEVFAYVAWAANSDLTCVNTGESRKAKFFVKYFSCVGKATNFYNANVANVDSMVIVTTNEINKVKTKGDLYKYLDTGTVTSC